MRVIIATVQHKHLIDYDLSYTDPNITDEIADKNW